MQLPQLFQFLSFYRSAQTIYQIDSPFVYDFMKHVLLSNQKPSLQKDIGRARRGLIQDSSIIAMPPLGAGSSTFAEHPTVARVAKTALSTPSQQALFFRIVKHYQPESIIELGTSFGLSAIHLQLGNPRAEVTSIEGRQQVVERAMALHEEIPFPGNRPNLICGTFEEQLPISLQSSPTLDLLFIDGDHRYQSLLAYYQTCMPHLHSKSIVLIHDIYWSAGMQQAWKELCNRPEVTVALDLFHSGILFFDTGVTQPLRLKLMASKWKPFSWGFFR